MRFRPLKILLATALVAGAIVALPNISVPEEADASTQTDFIAKLVKGAQTNERNTGIPASVTIGMAALESGWGRSTMATTVPATKTADGKKYTVNTLFNIKCGTIASPYQTGCVPMKVNEYTSGGKEYYTVSKFRTYSSWTNSMLDYGRLLTSASRYSAAFSYTKYPDQFVTEIRKGGYATDPNYATKVINIMASYNLYQYNVNGGKAGYPWKTAQTSKTYPTIAIGASGPTVKTLQRLINLRTGTSLTIDGGFGTATQNAVRQFQAINHLTVDGKAGDQTWAALVGTVRSGNSGRLVEIMQYELRYEGYTLTANKKFDATTLAVVQTYQQAKGLTVDGVVGTKTWAQLLKTTTQLTSPPTNTTVSPPSTTPVSYKSLKEGDSGSTVKTLQRLLNARAGTKITVDGLYGTTTVAGVKKFQKAKGISQTGTMNNATWKALLPALKKGATGTQVKILQYELRYSGFLTTINGKFDTTTVNAMKSYQKVKKISTTGGTGPRTWAALLVTNSSVSVFPELQRGDRGNDVRTLQRLLNARGGAKLTVDGVFGASTQSAVKKYQKEKKLSQTGIVDTNTWTKLAPTLKKGSTNSGAVKALQYELRYAGYSISATGKFDTATITAVKKYQSAKKLSASGTVGPTMWKKLLG